MRNWNYFFVFNKQEHFDQYGLYAIPSKIADKAMLQLFCKFGEN